MGNNFKSGGYLLKRKFLKKTVTKKKNHIFSLSKPLFNLKSAMRKYFQKIILFCNISRIFKEKFRFCLLKFGWGIGSAFQLWGKLTKKG